MENSINISPELALGWAETKFMTDANKQYHKDLIKAEMDQYGVVRKTTEFTAFEVIQGSGPALTVRGGTAIDQNGNVILQPSTLNNKFTLIEGAGVHTVILSFEETHLERFKVNIEAEGTLIMNAVVDVEGDDIGEGGFRSRVRGISQFPSLISFPLSTLNTGEYLVQTVVTDLHAVLNVGEGVLQPESNATWAVVGSFTPGVIIEDADKFPFKRGQAKLELLIGDFGLSIAADLDVNFPNNIFLATVNFNEGVVSITDRRSLNTYKKSTFI